MCAMNRKTLMYKGLPDAVMYNEAKGRIVRQLLKQDK